MSGQVDVRAQLPRGTVTFLFADIEGSTRLLNALGDRFGSVRGRSRAIVREVAGRHDGHEVDWAGDGVFLAFARARDAVLAAVDLQRALASEPWSPEEAIFLRIGVHTGEPQLDGEGYVGIDVVVAARICSAAHGGQIVVSQATREIVGDEPLPSVSFRPLGDHRLKDIAEPEPLFQVVAPDLTGEFPPLATLGGSTLPTLHHRLVGREAQVRELEQLLSRPDVRLVTVTGPGGTGKSRLALEVAAAAASRRPVHLVGLASISDPGLIPAAIARALGVRERPGQPLAATIADELAGKRALLYLDNLEHLASAASHVRSLLDGVPDLDVLATSRTPLRLSDEHVLVLDPLPLAEAVELFVERARSRGVTLGDEARPTIADLCARLDCLPLAIELVAARLTFMSPSQLLLELRSGAALELEGPVDLPERQRTLRATLDWSYGLLTTSQRALHEMLAVFAGGCTLEDARAVADRSATFLGDLEALVLASLVRGTTAGEEIRLSLLETVREHALARLDDEERLGELRARHAQRFVALATDAEAALEGPEQAMWLERLERELDNIRAALNWCLEDGRVAEALRAMAALGRFWRAHGHVEEARRWLAQGLEQAADVPSDVRADALWTAARQATAQHDFEAAAPELEQAAGLYRELGRAREAAFALSELAWVLLEHGELERAESLCEEALALAETAQDVRGRSGVLRIFSDVLAARGDLEASIAVQREVLALRRGLGDPLLVADATYHLGVGLFRVGRAPEARGALEESLALARRVGEANQQAAALFMLAELDLLEGQLDRAERQVRESLSVYTQFRNDRDRAECMVVLGGIATARGAYEEAARMLGAADALRGDAPLDLYELPVLERFQPQLEEALGAELLARLRAEGSAAGAPAAEVVPAGAAE